MALTHAAAFARLEVRLRDLRGRALRGPLTPAQLGELQRIADDIRGLLPRLRQYAAALAESRGLALEDTRALLARVEATDLEAAMAVVTELRRAGRVRASVHAQFQLVKRAPRDAAWADRLAALSMVLEEYEINPEAGMTRTLSRALAPGWWNDPQATDAVEATLRALRIDYSLLPDAR